MVSKYDDEFNTIMWSNDGEEWTGKNLPFLIDEYLMLQKLKNTQIHTAIINHGIREEFGGDPLRDISRFWDTSCENCKEHVLFDVHNNMSKIHYCPVCGAIIDEAKKA